MSTYIKQLTDPLNSDTILPITSTNAVMDANGTSLNNIITSTNARITNRNLLDNGWFTINQRGASSYSSNGYCVDRWILSNAGVTVGSGLTLQSNATLTQKFESAFTGSLTASARFSDDTIVSGSITRVIDTDQRFVIGEGSYRVALDMHSDNSFSVTNGTASTVVLKAVKLEVGTSSTLLMDVAPNYAEELLKCQRYFYMPYAHTLNAVTTGSSATDKICGNIVFPTAMRIDPTATIITSNFSDSIAVVGYASYSISNISIAYIGKVGVALYINCSENIPNSRYTTNKKAIINFSADL